MQVIKEDYFSSAGSGEGSDTTEHAGPGLGLGVVVEDRMPPKMQKRWVHQSVDTLRMEVDDSSELSFGGYKGMIFIYIIYIVDPQASWTSPGCFLSIRTVNNP